MIKYVAQVQWCFSDNLDQRELQTTNESAKIMQVLNFGYIKRNFPRTKILLKYIPLDKEYNGRINFCSNKEVCLLDEETKNDFVGTKTKKYFVWMKRKKNEFDWTKNILVFFSNKKTTQLFLLPFSSRVLLWDTVYHDDYRVYM